MLKVGNQQPRNAELEKHTWKEGDKTADKKPVFFKKIVVDLDGYGDV
jgi:hypothetical protein